MVVTRLAKLSTWKIFALGSITTLSAAIGITAGYDAMAVLIGTDWTRWILLFCYVVTLFTVTWFLPDPFIAAFKRRRRRDIAVLDAALDRYLEAYDEALIEDEEEHHHD